MKHILFGFMLSDIIGNLKQEKALAYFVTDSRFEMSCVKLRSVITSASRTN